MKNILCSMTNCHCGRGRLLVEDLIASTFKFILKVLIGLQFSATIKPDELDFIDVFFFPSCFVSSPKCDVGESFHLVNKMCMTGMREK